MPSEEYTSIPSSGKLKLKGVKDSRVTKKKKNKSSKDDKPAGGVEDTSVMLKKLGHEAKEMEGEESEKQGKPTELEQEQEGEEELGSRVKTEAEKRYDEQKRKRVRQQHL